MVTSLSRDLKAGVEIRQRFICLVLIHFDCAGDLSKFARVFTNETIAKLQSSVQVLVGFFKKSQMGESESLQHMSSYAQICVCDVGRRVRF